MSFEGYHSTLLGRELIAKLLAGEKLEITRVACGSGVCQSEDDVDNLTDLLEPRMDGTSDSPSYEGETMCMTVQFFSTSNQGDCFYLSEFGIYALDPDLGEILMYYFSQGENPQYFSNVNTKCQCILSFPISVAIGEDLEGVNLGYPPTTFVSQEALDNHNTSPTAHADLMHPRIQLYVSSHRPTDLGVFLWINQPPVGFTYPDSAPPEPEPTSYSYVELEGSTLEDLEKMTYQELEE